MKQKILVLVTLECGLRSKVDALDCEDGEMIQVWKEIGLSDSPKGLWYKTVMHAIGSGWRLMGPPVHIAEYAVGDEGPISAYRWWLEQ